MEKEKIIKKKSIFSRKKKPIAQEGKTPVISTRKGRLFSGIIVSDKMDKTVVVLIDRYKEHPKYKKRYKISKKYKVNDSKNEYKEGDKVIIQECRPISKNKKWRVIKKA